MDFPSFLLFSSSSEDPDWAWLPEPVLYLILTHLFLLSDIGSFGKVCSRWRSVFKFRRQKLCMTPNMSFKRPVPMLLIPTNDSSDSARNLYSLRHAGIYNLKLSVPFKNRCIGSSHGWLIFLDSLSFVITLFNPFYFGSSKGTIRLPTFLPAAHAKEMAKHYYERDYFSDYFICKAVLSSDPSGSDDFVLMLIHDETRSLAYYKSRDSIWTYLNNYLRGIFDIIYRQNSFLAVNFWGQVYLCDVKTDCLKFNVATEPVMAPVGGLTRRYIVESGDGTILQIVRLVESTPPSSGESSVLKTFNFLVFKLAIWGNSLEWVPMTCIGEGALFLGDNHSSYVMPVKDSGIISNAIYFTDDYPDVCTVHSKPYNFMGHRDIGIYLIRDQLFVKHNISPPWEKDMPPPIWMFPTI